VIEQYREHYATLKGYGRNAFFSSFDGGHTADEYFLLAQQNWNLNFFPAAVKHVKSLHGKTCLEIGFGGGGMLLAAATSFSKVCGIEIHGQGKYVLDELIAHDANADVYLVECDGESIPWYEPTFDFVFSWVVFLHLSIHQVEGYLSCIPQALNPEGIALIFYSPTDIGIREYEEDRVNMCRLQISDDSFGELAAYHGLEVLYTVQCLRPNGTQGHQHGAVMRRIER